MKKEYTLDEDGFMVETIGSKYGSEKSRKEPKRKKEKTYLVVYEKLDGSLDPTIIERMTIDKLKKEIRSGNVGAVAVIDGIMLRDFNDEWDDFEGL